MNAYEIRNHLELGNYNTTITREAFEQLFTKTKESIRFTFNGWDGKSYDGESRNAKVYRTSIEGFEEVRLVKVGKVDAEATKAAREDEVSRSLAEYRRNAKPASHEELNEMRAAFGKGQTVVNILTGERYSL